MTKGENDQITSENQTNDIYINNDYLQQINTFCLNISEKKESRKEIRKFFSEHPKAIEILKRQVLKKNNYEILVLHKILNMEVNQNLLLQSLNGKNINENNCILLHEMYFYRLVKDINLIKNKFSSTKSANHMILKSEEAAQYRIVDKDWDLHEQRKFNKCVIKKKMHDVFRMKRQLEKVPEYLSRLKKKPDFVIAIDIDNSFMHSIDDHSDKQLNSILKIHEKEFIVLINFLKDKKHTIILLQNKNSSVFAKKNKNYQDLHIFKYDQFDYLQVLKKFNKKRCFILKENVQFQKIAVNCFFVNLENIYASLFNDNN